MHLVLQLTQHQTELAEGLLIDLLVTRHTDIIEAYSNRKNECGVLCATFKEKNNITIGINTIKSTLTLVAPRKELPYHCNNFMINMGFFEQPTHAIIDILAAAYAVKVIHYLSRRTDVEWYNLRPS